LPTVLAFLTSLQKSSPKMGRKRTAEEGRKLAEQYGYNDDEVTADGSPVPRDVLDYTKGRCSVQMELWFERVAFDKETSFPNGIDKYKVKAGAIRRDPTKSTTFKAPKLTKNLRYILTKWRVS
jgi:hypothetical protein